MPLFDQNQLAIERSRIDGRQDHILPPGPNNIATEDLFSLAMNDEFLNQEKIAKKSQNPLTRHQKTPNAINGAVKPDAIPANPLKSTSTNFRFIMFCIFFFMGTIQ
jgi:hypothetical protein